MPEFFLDEAVRETVQPQGAGVFNLLGAVDGRQPFSSAKRFDGSPVETGDTTAVGIRQDVGGAKVRMITIVTLTLGGTNTLTANLTPWPSGLMYFSTSGQDAPDFNSGGTGEAYCTLPVPLTGLFGPDGILLQKILYRGSLLPPDLIAFLAQESVGDNEAVMSLGREGNSYSGLGGFFSQNNASTGTADAVDKFINPNAGQGRVDRPPIKVTPTIREITIGTGGVIDIAQYAPWFKPLIADAEYYVTCAKQGDPTTRLSGYWRGHATVPIPYCVEQSAEPPVLKFDLESGEVRIRNVGSSATFALTVERMA